MSELKMEPWPGVSVSEREKLEWAQNMIGMLRGEKPRFRPAGYDLTYTLSGDALVMVERWEGGEMEVWKCRIERHCRIKPEEP